MRTIFTLFATAVLSLHILLGCCWHHAHGAGAMPGHVHGPQAYDHVHVQALVPVHHHSGCDHEHDDSDKPEHHDICTDPQCMYLNAGVVTFDFHYLVATLPVANSDSLSQPNARQICGRWDDRGKSPPDVPLFLAYEHFLN